MTPAILSVRQWGGRIIDTSGLRRSKPAGILIHHTAGPNTPVETDEAAALTAGCALARSIQAFHMDGRGWRDSGQNFLVTRPGIVLEGRNGSLQAAAKGLVLQGAHCNNPTLNATWWGIENEGTYTSDLPPPEAWEALVELCAWLCFRGDLDSIHIAGHRDVRKTACPGDALYGRLADLRHAVHLRKQALIDADGAAP